MIAVALDLFLVLVARRLNLHLAWTVPEFLLPLALPASPDAILVLDLTLELPALGFALHPARTANRVTTSCTPVRTEADLTGPLACPTRLRGHPPDD
jgi:hypothetical protein